jgi:radical SAM superfamily enzyme YgiQ (UPF0313 family)
MITLINAPGIKTFSGLRWIVDFCHELIDRGLDITWQLPSGTRAEVFDAEVADLLYRSGCRALAFAPESGSPAILKAVKKQVDLGHMMDAMQSAVRRGLKLSCFIVIGLPDDTPATLRDTLRLIRRMAVLGVHDVAVSKLVPYPGFDAVPAAAAGAQAPARRRSRPIAALQARSR